MLPPIFYYTYKIIKKDYPGESVNIHVIVNKYYPGEKLGNHHQKRLRVIYHYFMVTENGKFPPMVDTESFIVDKL